MFVLRRKKNWDCVSGENNKINLNAESQVLWDSPKYSALEKNNTLLKLNMLQILFKCSSICVTGGDCYPHWPSPKTLDGSSVSVQDHSSIRSDHCHLFQLLCTSVTGAQRHPAASSWFRHRRPGPAQPQVPMLKHTFTHNTAHITSCHHQHQIHSVTA